MLVPERTLSSLLAMTRRESLCSNYFKYSAAIALVSIIISDIKFYLSKLLNGIKEKNSKDTRY